MAASNLEPDVPKAVGNGRFLLVKKIGKGSFGTVYKAFDTVVNQECAVKLELIFPSDPSKSRQLQNEANVCQLICTEESSFPTYISKGQEGNYYYMAMELLGHNLEVLFNLCGRKFSIKIILLLGYQALNLIEAVHFHNFVYCDIKPENFMMDINFKKLYLGDFGMMKRYKKSLDGVHVPYRKDRPFCGTLRYASLRSIKGIQVSRRDDLEALCYMLVYFVDGNLPWMKLAEKDSSHNLDKILQRKSKYSIEYLCSSFPPLFSQFFRYCRNLKYDETPDYSYLRGLLLKMI